MARSAQHMFRRGIPALAMVVLFTGTAFAQVNMNVLGGDRRRSPEEIMKEDQTENDYRAATSKIPDAKVTRDPWGVVRSTPPAPPPASKQTSTNYKKQP